MKERKFTVLALALLALGIASRSVQAQPTYPSYTFTVLAGVQSGHFDGLGRAARLLLPSGLAVGKDDEIITSSRDWSSGPGSLRRIVLWGTNWVVTTLTWVSANSVVADRAGNLFFATDTAIQEETPDGVILPVAGGSQGSADGIGAAAQFSEWMGLTIDDQGSIYVADEGNHTIRKVAPAGTNWVVTTLAGLAGVSGSANGTGSGARFNLPTSVAVDTNGVLYVADSGNSTVRKITPDGTNWVVATLAGRPGVTGSADGTGSNARFNTATAVAVDNTGNVYVVDSTPQSGGGNSTIRRISPAGVVTTLAGSVGTDGGLDGVGTAAQFDFPTGVALDSGGEIYVACRETLRRMALVGTNWVVTTIAGRVSRGSADGTGSAAQFSGPRGIAIATNGVVYVADTGSSTIRKITPDGVVTTLAGLAGIAGTSDGVGSTARFNGPQGVVVDDASNVYVADSSSHTIRKVTPDGVVTTLAGDPSRVILNAAPGDSGGGYADGVGSAALFCYPDCMAIDASGNLYVGEGGSFLGANNDVRKATPDGEVTTLAILERWDGSCCPVVSSDPQGVAVDSLGNAYVADFWNHAIRQAAPDGTVTTFAGLLGSPGYVDGTGSDARFNRPCSLAVDSAGNLLVGEYGSGRVRIVTPGAVVTTLPGAAFRYPRGVAVDGSGAIYVADAYGYTVSKGIPSSLVPAPSLGSPSLIAGQFGFGISGFAGLVLDIQSSTDLTNWQTVGTCILEGGTNFFFSPTVPKGNQFFRAHIP